MLAYPHIAIHHGKHLQCTLAGPELGHVEAHRLQQCKKGHWKCMSAVQGSTVADGDAEQQTPSISYAEPTSSQGPSSTGASTKVGCGLALALSALSLFSCIDSQLCACQHGSAHTEETQFQLAVQFLHPLLANDQVPCWIRARLPAC